MAGAGARTILWSYLGRVPYGPAVALQERVRDEVSRGEGPERLLLLEHPHIYTLGRSARRDDVLAGAEWLRAKGIEVAPCDRGGQVTYHGPGQLVGYPILSLHPDRRDLRRYVRALETVLVRTLADFGVEALGLLDRGQVGVWSGPLKVASIGVHVRRWVTTHGFALNVSTDLSYFAGIVACGLHGVQITSLERLTGRRVSLEEVAPVLAGHFGEVFSRRLEATDIAVPSQASRDVALR